MDALALSEKMRSELSVDFYSNTQEKAVEILTLLLDRGLARYCSAHSIECRTLDAYAVQFLIRAKFRGDGLSKKVNGQDLVIT